MPVPVTAGKPSEKGAALMIVVMALMMLAGVMMLLGTGAFKLDSEQDRIRRTQKTQIFLMREISAYVQRENQLPCPASPAVDPLTAAFGQPVPVCNTVATARGVVPFRALHLSQRDAVDGWGRYMTYAISPITANPGTDDVNDKIYMRCRRHAWFDGSPALTPYNVNKTKARFCCPMIGGAIGTNTDLRVFVQFADIALNKTIDGIGRKGAALPVPPPSYYAPPDTPWTTGDGQGDLAPIPAVAGNEELFAVAVISHGQNGAGAYVAGTAGQMPVTAAGTDEQVNATVGTDIIAHPMILTSGANYFDDMVAWRTQVSLMGELNNATCYMPWR